MSLNEDEQWVNDNYVSNKLTSVTASTLFLIKIVTCERGQSRALINEVTIFNKTRIC